MSEIKKMVPKRRFKEFQNADAWELRKLSDLCEKFTDGDWIETKDQSNEGVRLIQTGNIGVTKFLDKANNAKWISEDTFNRLNCEEVFAGDILVSRLPEPAGRACIIPDTGDRMITAVDCTIVRVNSNTENKYLVQYLATESYFNEVAMELAGGTRQRISRSNLANFMIPIPNKLEQKKIGVFFSNLDNLITLHQRKLEKIKSIKLAYLSEMFPVHGERTPKHRFSGFTDAWELRRVNEIFKVTRGQVLAATETSGKQSTEMPYPVYSSQTKNDGLMGYYNNYLFDTAITWTTDGANAGTVNYRKGKFYSTNVNGVLLSSAGFANKAIAEILNQEAWKWVSHVGNPKLMNNVMGDIIISIPPSLEEHNRLSEFFTSLDNLITLHQQKLEKLQNIKEAYLNELFI